MMRLLHKAECLLPFARNKNAGKHIEKINFSLFKCGQVHDND